MRFSCFFAAAALMPTAALAQPASPPPPAQPTAPPTDAECFLIAAIGSQQLTSGPNRPPEAQQMEPVLRGTANYFAGRLSTQFSAEQLRQALAAAGPAVRRPDLGRLVVSCTTAFQNFMRAVAERAPD
jgi:hypothetical protein